MHDFVDVILPIPLEKQFTYSITRAEAQYLKPGMRVSVPFGKSKIYTALVFRVHQNEPKHYAAKSIQYILDKRSIVNEIQIKFWSWIASYYMCTLGDVMRAALPNALILESETLIFKTEIKADENTLADDEFLILEALEHQSSLKIQDIVAILGKKNILPTVNTLIKKELIGINKIIQSKYKPKRIRYIRLNKAYNTEIALKNLLENELKRAPKQSQVILNFFALKNKSIRAIKASDLIKESQVSTTIINTLVTKNILEDYYKDIDRLSYSQQKNLRLQKLSKNQNLALNTINKSFISHNSVLFHGITSSGKTEIYTHLIKDQLLKGKQILYLLPEIALTTQLVTRLQTYFGDKMAVYHSKYSQNERVEVWNNVLKNKSKARLILGARSSLLLPFSNLGLIIIDEEHEPSYKQFDPAPRYHARDAAIVLAKLHKAKTLLGSATPSLESYFNAKQNKYGFVELKQRFNDVLLPQIKLVNIKEELKRKCMKGHFSLYMLNEMKKTLAANKQIILFQNRRGFAPIIECITCGHSPQCPNCDVSLTYHQQKSQLRCHYCGYLIAMQSQCLACGSHNISSKGFGTEQIEEEVKVLFPKTNIARMDLDTTRGKHGYEKIINAFENDEINILIGTQMITKGLDFKNVALVGVLNADSMLHFPDFRINERSFQLLVQVSGRSGRTKERGNVIIQTYNPQHKILQHVIANNYNAMFKDELQDRQYYKYPPFYRLIRIIIKHKDFNKVQRGSDWFAKSLKQVFKDNILGPEAPVVSRIRNQYLKYILIKIPPEQSIKKTKEIILKIKKSFFAIAEFKSLRLIEDVDSY